MLGQIQETIRRHGLIQPGSRIVVGVSGGADSVCLLYALHFLRGRIGVQVSVAHLNHGIRGAAADRDEIFVRHLAWQLGLSFTCGKADVPQLARRRGISIEMAARRARHELFAHACAEAEAEMVATAHTADDQAETILLRLLRGTGAQGLGGMAYSSTQEGVAVIRPMLNVTHADAVRFLRHHRLRWREDATNSDPEFLRNRVRHELLPFLEKKFNPQIRRALVRTADILRDENEWLDAIVARRLKRLRAGAGKNSLRAGALARLPLPQRRRVIVQWLFLNGVAPECVDFDAVDRVLQLIQGAEGTREVPISGTHRVMRRYDTLSVDAVLGREARAFSVPINVPGTTRVADLQVTAVLEQGFVRPARSRPGKFPATASLSEKAVGKSALIVRSWRAGDRIRPLGMTGSRKVQDILVDRKVPRDGREQIPVVECRGEIVWVPGYTVARGWEVPGAGAPSIRLTLGKSQKAHLFL